MCRGGPLLLDLGEPVAQHPGHLGLREGRRGEHLGQHRCGRGEMAGGHVDVDEQAPVGHAGPEHHPVSLHQLRELLGPVLGGALVEEPRRHRPDALLALGLVGQRGRDDHPQGQDVLTGEVVDEHADAVVQGELPRHREGPRERRCDDGARGAHATSSSCEASARR